MDNKDARFKPIYFVFALLIVAIGFFATRLVRMRGSNANGFVATNATKEPTTDAKILALQLAGHLSQVQSGKIGCEPGFTKQNASDPEGFERFVSLATCKSADGLTTYNSISYASVLASAVVQQTRVEPSCTPQGLEKTFGVPKENIKEDADGLRGLFATSTSAAEKTAWPRDLILTVTCRKAEPQVLRWVANMPAAAILMKDVLPDVLERKSRQPVLVEPVSAISDVVNVEVLHRKDKNFDSLRGALESRNKGYVTPLLEKTLKYASENNYPESSVELVKKVLAQTQDKDLMADQLRKNIAVLPR